MKQILKTKIPIIAIIIITICTACGKKNPSPPAPTTDKFGLPLPTQTGANIFGCLIDGVPFVVKGEWNWLTGDGIEFISSIKDSFFIMHSTINNPRKKLGLIAKIQNNIIGQHPANKYVLAGYTYFQNGSSPIPGQNGYFVANDSLPSSITITNTDNFWATTDIKGKFVSGTFDLTLAKSDGTIMRITEGRFDYKFP